MRAPGILGGSLESLVVSEGSDEHASRVGPLLTVVLRPYR